MKAACWELLSISDVSTAEKMPLWESLCPCHYRPKSCQTFWPACHKWSPALVCGIWGP